MRLENSFTVPTSPERAWDILLDVPAIAGCVPGARLTEVVDDVTYKGEAAVKIGPVALTFGGQAQIVEADAAARRARIEARGADKRGRGNARADVVFQLSPAEGAGTRVDVKTDLQLAGTVAQYGRGAGLMEAVAGEIIGEFARNLEARIKGEDAEDQAAAAPVAAAAAAAGAQPGGAGSPSGPPSAPDAARPQDRFDAASQQGQGSLNVLSILWRALVSGLHRLLGGAARRQD